MYLLVYTEDKKNELQRDVLLDDLQSNPYMKSHVIPVLSKSLATDKKSIVLAINEVLQKSNTTNLSVQNFTDELSSYLGDWLGGDSSKYQDMKDNIADTILDAILQIKSEVDKKTDNNSKTIVFVVTDVIKQGLQKAHITIPFNCALDAIDASVMASGNNDLEIQVQKTTDFAIWTDVLDSPINIVNGTNKSTVNTFTNPITFNEGDILTLDVLTDSKCESLSVNLKVTKQ